MQGSVIHTDSENPECVANKCPAHKKAKDRLDERKVARRVKAESLNQLLR